MFFIFCISDLMWNLGELPWRFFLCVYIYIYMKKQRENNKHTSSLFLYIAIIDLYKVSRIPVIRRNLRELLLCYVWIANRKFCYILQPRPPQFDFFLLAFGFGFCFTVFVSHHKLIYNFVQRTLLAIKDHKIHKWFFGS